MSLIARINEASPLWGLIPTKEDGMTGITPGEMKRKCANASTDHLRVWRLDRRARLARIADAELKRRLGGEATDAVRGGDGAA